MYCVPARVHGHAEKDARRGRRQRPRQARVARLDLRRHSAAQGESMVERSTLGRPRPSRALQCAPFAPYLTPPQGKHTAPSALSPFLRSELVLRARLSPQLTLRCGAGNGGEDVTPACESSARWSNVNSSISVVRHVSRFPANALPSSLPCSLSSISLLMKAPLHACTGPVQENSPKSPHQSLRRSPLNPVLHFQSSFNYLFFLIHELFRCNRN